MSRIQQLAEHAQMRERIRQLEEDVQCLEGAMDHAFKLIEELKQAIGTLQSIAKPLESPKRPGRPRKDDGGIIAGGDRAPRDAS